MNEEIQTEKNKSVLMEFINSDNQFTSFRQSIGSKNVLYGSQIRESVIQTIFFLLDQNKQGNIFHSLSYISELYVASSNVYYVNKYKTFDFYFVELSKSLFIFLLLKLLNTGTPQSLNYVSSSLLSLVKSSIQVENKGISANIYEIFNHQPYWNEDAYKLSITLKGILKNKTPKEFDFLVHIVIFSLFNSMGLLEDTEETHDPMYMIAEAFLETSIKDLPILTKLLKKRLMEAGFITLFDIINSSEKELKNYQWMSKKYFEKIVTLLETYNLTFRIK